jgi:hypothetical protein
MNIENYTKNFNRYSKEEGIGNVYSVARSVACGLIRLNSRVRPSLFASAVYSNGTLDIPPI